MSHRPGVPIGSGKIAELARMFPDIEWNNPYTATKFLLEHYVARDASATHTGQSSLPFKENPVNIEIVKDIIDSVSLMYGISPSDVRGYIMKICAGKRNMLEQDNQENVQASTSSSKQIGRRSEKEAQSKSPAARHQSGLTSRDDTSSSDTDAEQEVPRWSGIITELASMFPGIEWNNPYTATKFLLEHYVSTDDSTTHTGQSSLVFEEKPVNMKIKDIINSVSMMYGISKRIVRNDITKICADERNMPEQDDQENVQPSTSSSKQMGRRSEKETQTKSPAARH